MKKFRVILQKYNVLQASRRSYTSAILVTRATPSVGLRTKTT